MPYFLDLKTLITKKPFDHHTKYSFFLALLVTQKQFYVIHLNRHVEGFLGGLFFSTIGGYAIFEITQNTLFSKWLILSVIVSVFGTIGDLIESKYKRQAEVKDSGTLIPGHGGLLDRLDSALFVAPFIYLFLRILNYVS